MGVGRYHCIDGVFTALMETVSRTATATINLRKSLQSNLLNVLQVNDHKSL